jgi:hypothetical protein
MTDEHPAVVGGPRRRRMLVTAANALSAGLALAALLGLAAVAADAALHLPERARAATPWVAGGCAAAVATLGLFRLRQLRAARVARELERRDPALGNALTNAVQLARQRSPTPVGEFLRRQTVRRGEQAARAARVWPLVRRGTLAVATMLAAAGLMWTVCVTMFSPVWEAVWPRFADPFGDHPPYSRVRIAVEPGDAEVLYGGHLEVRARASGGPVEKLYLVARGADGPARATMFMASDRTFFQSLANLRWPAEYWVTDGRARSHRFSIGVRYTPRIESVELTLRFPEYTRRPPRATKLDEEPVQAPLDTRIEFRVASNRPLARGTLTVTPLLGGQPHAVTLAPLERGGDDGEAGPATVVQGAFELDQPVAFSITVTDVDGLTSNDQRTGRVHVLPDRRPQIFVLQPGRNAVATPSVSIPVRVQATDDYGVTRVLWFRGHNKSIERPLSMKLQMQRGPASVEAAGALHLAELGVRPGDVIDYFFEAADNDPRGPNVVTSRLYSVQIISEEQYAEILRRMAAQHALFDAYIQLSNWVRRLSERAEALARKAAGLEKLAGEQAAAARDAILSEMRALAGEIAEWQEALQRLSAQPELFDLEGALRDALARQAAGLQRAARELSEMAGSGAVRPEALSALAGRLKRSAAAADEQVGEPLRHLETVVRLMVEADRFVKLAGQQAELAHLLRRFQDRAGELSRTEQMSLQELAQAQRRIQAGLRDLVGALPELLERVPRESVYDPLRESVNDFLEAVSALKIQDDIHESARWLDELNGHDGFGHALAAAQNMDKLIAKCRGEGGIAGQAEHCLKFQPVLQQALGNSLQQILNALGAGGQGPAGRHGYSLFNEAMGLYGPNAELFGEQAADRSGPAGEAAAARSETVTADTQDPALELPEVRTRVPLQHDVKFPLRYRHLVGEYFRAIAESQEE